MNFKLTGRNLEITPAMETLLDKKLAKLDRFFPADVEASVFLRAGKDRSRIEITVPVKGSTIRCEQEGADLYALMDDAVDAMERQLKKYRGKLRDRYQSAVVAAETAEESAEEAEPIRIVRSKRFAVKPMDAEEACLQMELLGHDFYMFLNSESNEVNVVYRRKDGAFGLIEPVLDDEE